MNHATSIQFKESTRNGPFWTALRRRGYAIEELFFDDVPMVRLTSKAGKRWLTSTNISYPTTSFLVSFIAQDKALAYALARQMNISVPFTRRVSMKDTVDIQDIVSIYERLVVKPFDSFGSRGVALDITNQSELDWALKDAFVHSQGALIQQQVVGDELRFTAIDGKVVSVLLRQTPRVIGDGSSTVSELIEAENMKRHELVTEYIQYPQLNDQIIAASHLSDQTILKVGEVLELNKATMVKNGATIYEILDEMHPGYLRLAEKMADQLASSLIVIDFFVQDYKTAPMSDNYWFNEFNTSPALRLYYAAINKDDSHVANMIVDKFDKMITEGL